MTISHPGVGRRSPWWRVSALAVLALVAGCENRAAPEPRHGPFGPALPSRLLAPFQGAWKFDVEQTLAAQKAAGAPEDEITRLRKMYETRPELIPEGDLVIRDNEALGFHRPSSEYRFFHLHRHDDGTVCGKAWHHEDRFDPGDMSKCYVGLAIIDGRLHFRSHMAEGLPDLNDPDLESPLPVDLDAAGKCEAKTGQDWAELMVFVRAAAN